MPLLILLLLAFVSFAASPAEISESMEWQTVPQSRISLTLDSTTRFRVDSLEFDQRDAAQDLVAYSFADQFMYSTMNALHIETKESVVRKLLLFQLGDTVQLSSLIESERLLRGQKYFSDAKIEAFKGENGANILKITTSDHWTTTPVLAPSMPGDKLIWSVGLLENNFLGYGQSLGLYYAQDEERDSWLLRYGNPHFIIPNHKILAEYALTSDGYGAAFSMGRPFLSRSRNEWSYSVDATSIQQDWVRYSSQDQLVARTLLEAPAKTVYEPRKESNLALVWKGVREDSVAFRMGRSFGTGLKLYVRGTWEWLKRENYDTLWLKRYRVTENDSNMAWTMDSTFAHNAFPVELDSRLGVHFTLSRVRYATLKNYHRIKWTEDVDKGWSVVGALGRNIPELGAANNNYYGNIAVAMAFGETGGLHHASLRSQWQGEYAYDDLQKTEPQANQKLSDLYGKMQVEYMFKPSNEYATVASFMYDHWRNTPWGRQLSLGGIQGLNGFPSHVLVGQARTLMSLEQRWFPHFEFGTVVPVFVGFVQSGQVKESLKEIDKDFETVVGVGLRLGMSKSVEGVINSVNLSWPVKGSLEKSLLPRFSFLATVAL